MICLSDVVVEGGGVDLPTASSAPVGVPPSVGASAGTICLLDVDAALPFPFALAVVASVVVFDFGTAGTSLFADLPRSYLFDSLA